MQYIYQGKNASVYYDRSTKTIGAEWNGEVTTEEFQLCFSAINKQTSLLQEFNLVFDFGKMHNINTESQAWFQNEFIINEGSGLLAKINKFAVVKPKGMMAKFIAANILKWCEHVSPELKPQQFDSEDDAQNWMGKQKERPQSMIIPFISFMMQAIGINLTT